MTDTSFPDKTELMRRIHASRLELETLLGQLSDAQMLIPGPNGWSVKDHLAHLVVWEQSLLGLLNGQPRHEVMGVPEAVYRQGVDAVNDYIVAHNRDRSLDEVMGDFRRSYQAVLARLTELTDADLRQPYGYYLPNDRADDSPPVLNWVLGDTYEHYDEHLQWIQDLMATWD